MASHPTDPASPGGPGGHSTAPAGVARRGRLLSGHETEQRMIRAAVAMMTRAVATVSLDHISFGDVVRDAGVSRGAVYRRWPYKDLFFARPVRELAKDATPAIVADELAMLRRVAADRPDWLETSELRHGLVIEMFRQLSLLDFQTLFESAGWRTYLALHATFMSLADGELRNRSGSLWRRSQRETPGPGRAGLGEAGRTAGLPAAS